MVRITNSDHALVLLRNYLERQSKTRKTSPAQPSERAGPQGEPSPVKRAKAILAQENLDDEQLAEVLVAGLLTQEFGPRLASDPKFASLVQDVVRTIRLSDEGKALLPKAAAQLISE